MIRFGIIGCGSAAVPVAQAIVDSPLTQLSGVFDIDSNLAEDLAKRFAIAAASSQDELLANPEIDAVYIAVPHDLLYPIAMQVLQAGKHALVEKPLSIHLSDAEELVNFAETRRLTLGVYYEMHHAGPYQFARKLVKEHALGQIIGVHIQTLIDKPLDYWQSGYSGRKISPWRGQRQHAGGGVLLMNTSHLLEAVGYITGLEVTQVTGATATLVAPVEVEDLAAATLIYSNGAIGSILAGAHLAGSQVGDERIHLYGTLGQLRLPDPYGNGQLQVYLRQPWDGLKAEQWQSLPAPQTNVHRSAVEEFALAVTRGEIPSSNGRTASHVLATVLAVYHAANRQRMIRIKEVNIIESELRQHEH
jgi:UDP-N-acetyl-2-amino-2-deoxyglucuronate dehydrogenase